MFTVFKVADSTENLKIENYVIRNIQQLDWKWNEAEWRSVLKGLINFETDVVAFLYNIMFSVELFQIFNSAQKERWSRNLPIFCE